MKPPLSKLFFLTVLGLSVVALSQPCAAQTKKTGLIVDLFGNQNSKKNSSSNNKKKSSSAEKKRTSSSSRSSNSSSRNSSTSKGKADFLTQLTGKTPEERAKAESERKKAAAAKAKADARNKAIADAAREKADMAKEKENARKIAIAAAEKKKADEMAAKVAAAKQKQREIDRANDLAKKKKQEEDRARQMAESKRASEAREVALNARKQKEDRARQLLAAARAKEETRRKMAEERTREQQRADAELVAHAHGRKPRGGGLFGFRSRTTNLAAFQQSSAIQSPPSRYLYINEREISQLNSGNSRIEIDLSDQRARVYRGNTLMIETQISSGKSGFRTPTGSYSVQEKLVEKKSGRYGTWYNSAGVQLRGDDHHNPPPGASQFVGADMPYWMRITGGIGMHIGYVPDGAASHGCVRVPSNVQPLIFSKVKVGTPITIKG